MRCVEINWAAMRRLNDLGFDVLRADFLEVRPEDIGVAFDRVVMNPSFSAEVEHVRHAWTFLRPGGRLVAIMSAGIRFRRDAEAFRSFVADHGSMEELPAGSFAPSGTGVNTVLVVLDK